MPEQDEYDSPWKEALEVYLQAMMTFCFPEHATKIDWPRGAEFLDKELQEISRDAALGRQHVDKLVKVRLVDSSEEWILIHVEVQSQPDKNLPLRVYQYHHRVRDRFGKRVASFVILADERTGWHPVSFEEELLGTHILFRFASCKLLDLLASAHAAARAAHPSAVIILANWAAQNTRNDMRERLRLKWDLTRQLYEAGFGRRDILELYRLLDWLMRLPDGLEREYKQQLNEYEQSRSMPYVTSIERIGHQEGRQEGREEGRQEGVLEGLTALRESVTDILTKRFGAVPAETCRRLDNETDLSALKALLLKAATCRDLTDFREPFAED